MSNSGQKYTPQQQAAIDYRSGSLLVSSAAGSGKTMVLVERLLGYITDEKKNIDDFLVITYTRAAAGELRERIHIRLTEKLCANPGNKHLHRQLMLCKGANIDTIHAFCAVILRENAHIAEIAHDFKVADENECNAVKDEALDEVFNRTYNVSKDEKDVSELLDMFIEGRDDKKLMNIVRNIHQKLMSTPKPKVWKDSQIAKMKCDDITDISETEFGRYLIEVMTAHIKQILKKIQMLQHSAQAHPDFCDKYGASVNEMMTYTEALHNGLMNGWDEAKKNANFSFSRPGNIKGYDDLKETRKWCIGELKKIAKQLITGSADHVKDLKAIYPAMKKLLNLVIEFDEQYTAAKRKRGIVDFSDLEHLTLSLLLDKKTGKKTQIAEAISKRFTEILIDEYQDINEVQETLFRTLSKNEENIFMVGDVKQSIYRFRLAEPGIFIEKYKKYETYIPVSAADDNEKQQKRSVKINLSNNFRSNPDVLETINYIFRNIMSIQFGEIEYNDEVALIPGREQQKQGKQGITGKQGIEKNDLPVTLELLTAGQTLQEDEESPELIQYEAEYLAKRIKKLIDSEFIICDKDGTMRPVRSGDIAILSRTVKGKVWRYASALTDIDIQTDISNTEEFFETIEIQTILNILSIIDNPRQDIPLAAVLSSPIYNITAEELAQIRAIYRKETFFNAVAKTAEHDTGSSELCCKCKTIMNELESLRAIASDIPADRFIWNVYNKTRMIEKMSALKGGKLRKENLLTLVRIAQEYEENGYKGLFGFLQHIYRLMEKGADIANKQENISSSGNGGVKIMSIHKSKGLEFPVVFLVDTAKRQNLIDLNETVVFHKELGIGGYITNKEKRIRYATICRDAIKEKLRREILSEELRVLYVAMTRAREKLVILGTFKDAGKVQKKVMMHADSDGTYSAQSLMSMNTVAEWLMAGLTNHMQAENIIKHIDVPEISEQEAECLNEKPGRQPEIPLSYEGVTKMILPVENYPYNASTQLPSKLTITAIKSIADPEAQDAIWVKTKHRENGIYRAPRFVKPDIRSTGAERGTTIHHIMRHVDYNKSSTEPETWEQLRLLTKMGIINETDVSKLENDDIKKIVTFFNSNIGKRIKGTMNLKREFKFSLLVPSKKYYPQGGDDEILLQGIIDCFFEEDDEYVIVDYKTDNLKNNTIENCITKYTPQLTGYSEALERITGKRVKERIIYFFDTGIAVNV